MKMVTNLMVANSMVANPMVENPTVATLTAANPFGSENHGFGLDPMVPKIPQ